MPKKNHALRTIIIFMAIMAIVTFFSQTVRYAAIPKVETALSTGGTLKYVYDSGDYVLNVTETRKICIPDEISDAALIIEEIYVRPHDAIKTGDPLMRFNADAGLRALAASEAECGKQARAIEEFDTDKNAAVQEIERQIDELKDELKTDIENQNALVSKISELEASENGIIASDIWNGILRGDMEKALSESQAATNALASLRDADWKLISPIDAFVGTVDSSAGDSCTAFDVLMTLNARNGDTKIGLKTNILTQDAATMEFSVYIPKGTKSSELDGWEFCEAEPFEGGTMLWAASIDGATPEKLPGTMAFQAQSERYQYLVPNSAVIGDSIYKLGTRAGAFGGDETYAIQVNLKNPPSDDTHTAIESGLTGTDKVIIGWDRAFQDGDTVIIPYE